MNINMHGKAADSIEFANGPSGNPDSWVAGSGAVARISLSATHHGDHDEFWFVAYGADGEELGRRNARNVEHVTWTRSTP